MDERGRRLALCFIIIRAGLDTVFLLISFLFSSPVVDLAVRWGWPINTFWSLTVIPITGVMTFGGLWILLDKAEPDTLFSVPIIFVSLFWAGVLLLYKGITVLRVVDALLWIAVAVLVWLLHRQWKSEHVG